MTPCQKAVSRSVTWKGLPGNCPQACYWFCDCPQVVSCQLNGWLPDFSYRSVHAKKETVRIMTVFRGMIIPPFLRTWLLGQSLKLFFCCWTVSEKTRVLQAVCSRSGAAAAANFFLMRAARSLAKWLPGHTLQFYQVALPYLMENRGSWGNLISFLPGIFPRSLKSGH